MNALTTIAAGLSITACNSMTSAISSSTPSLRINAAVMCSALLLLSQATGALGAADWKKRFKIGKEILDSDGSSDKPLAQQYGPFYSAEMKCHSLGLSLFSSFVEPFANPFTDFSVCPAPQFHPEAYAETVDHETLKVMEPYVNAVKGLVPARNSPVTSFPSNMEAFVMNERFLIKNGNRGCDLRDGWLVYGNCKEMHQLDIIKNAFKDSYQRDDAFRGNGLPIEIPLDGLNTNIILHIAINPMIAQNYRSGLDLASTTILQNPCFFKKSTDEILEFIKDLHRTLTEGLPARHAESDSQMRPGEYRKTFVTINHDQNVEWTADSLTGQLKKLGATQTEIQRYYNSALQKAMDYQAGGLHPDKSLTKGEKKLISKLFSFPPDYPEIPEMMHKFVVDLKDYASREIHPVALAAWAHCELGRIHPFSDANGRIARILMNAILIRGGYEPIVIPDDGKYTAAINSNLENPGAFAKYLGGLTKSRRSGQELLNRVSA